MGENENFLHLLGLSVKVVASLKGFPTMMYEPFENK